MFRLELYGIGADGKPAEMPIGQFRPTVEAAKAEAHRLFTEARFWSLERAFGCRVRDSAAMIVFQEQF